MKVARRLATLGAFLGVLCRLQAADRETSAAGHALALKAPAGVRGFGESYPSAAHPQEPIKLAVFERINEDRLRASLSPLAWDEEASRVADAFCAQQVREATRAHFLMNGIPPYARTSFAGVLGKSSENSVSWLTTASSFADPTIALALGGQRDMMAERPPSDGHRRTILDPAATHVGVGYAIEAGRFQMAEEFLVRDLERLGFSVSPAKHPIVRFDGKTRPHRNLRFVTIAWESPPRHLSREQANARTTYSYPKPYLSYVPEGSRMFHVSDTDNQNRLQMRRDDSFAFAFSPQEAGLYTLVFYTSESEGIDPRPGASASLWFE